MIEINAAVELEGSYLKYKLIKYHSGLIWEWVTKQSIIYFDIEHTLAQYNKDEVIGMLLLDYSRFRKINPFYIFYEDGDLEGERIE